MQSSDSLATQHGTARFLLHDTPVSLVVGQIVTVNLRVQNVGASVWRQTGRAAVYVGYRWFDQTGQPVLGVEDRRTALPREVAPNEPVALGALLATPRTPGNYQLVWDLAVGVTWFDAPLRVPVNVTAAPCEATGWRAQSPLNPANVVHTIDGDMFTTWDSEALQAPGQWFRLNLGMPRVVDGVQWLSPGHGFPGGYVLHASLDGKTWNALARVASGNAHDVVAIFAPQKIQYLQMDLLASVAEHWLIADVLIHSATAWTASTSHNTAAASHAIDNRSETRWTSDAPQSPAMWFQIDLGRVEVVSGVALDSPAEQRAASLRITTWNASASRWQIVYEAARVDAPVDVTFNATPTQFVNVQLLSAADRPWSIRRVDIVREMETWLSPSST